MKVVTFGEIMLRLTPPEHHTLESTKNLQVNYGGGEANVAISLSKFGHETVFVSRLPKNQLGDSAIRYLNGFNVNTKFIDRGGTNIGIYFLEVGFGGRNSKVIYNRKYAAITSIRSEKFDFDKIFKDAKWFHVSGISLALGDNVRETLFDMLEYAKKNDITVSFDCNYRRTLWSIEEAAPHFQRLLPYVNILFASAFDVEELFGFKRNGIVDKKASDIELYQRLIKESNVEKIFGTKRKVYSSNDNELSAYLVTEDRFIESEPIRFNIYDRIGGGDAFAAGIINGMLEKETDLKYVLDFGLSTSVLKHTLWGDAFTLNKEDVLRYMKNKAEAVNR